MPAERAFACDEPSYQAGVYRDVLLHQWRKPAGAQHVGLPGGRTGGNRYLVLGGEGQAGDLAVPPDRDELIAYEPLLSDNGATWLGTTMLVRGPSILSSSCGLRSLTDMRPSGPASGYLPPTPGTAGNSHRQAANE